MPVHQTVSRIVPPVSCLPSELISNIFEEVVGDWEEQNDNTWSELWGFLASVSLVCWRWHDVALQTPKLWRNVFCGYHSLVPYQSCVYRSGATSLNIWTANLKSTQDILTHLISKDVDNRINHLHMKLRDAYDLYADVLPDALSMPVIPTTRIFVHDLNLLSHHFAAFLLRFPEVKSLHLIHSRVHYAFVELADRTVLSRLRVLLIRMRVFHDLIFTLRTFAAPALEDFHICIDDEGGVQPLESQESFGSLRKLTLEGPIGVESIMGLLPWFRHIETLEIMTREKPDLTLERLCSLNDIVVPHLHTLALSEPPEDCTILLDIVETRSLSPLTKPLKLLKLAGSIESDPQAPSMELQELQVKVEVTWWDPPRAMRPFKRV